MLVRTKVESRRQRRVQMCCVCANLRADSGESEQVGCLGEGEPGSRQSRKRAHSLQVT